MFIRVAKKNPTQDFSVPGRAPNSIIIKQVYWRPTDPQEIINRLLRAGWVVKFTAAELAEALEAGDAAVDALPQLHVDGVCCFEADSIEEWARECSDALFRMGYITPFGDLTEPDLRVWVVEGDPIDIEDYEGVYVKSRSAKDITAEAVEILDDVHGELCL